jgi:peptide/nickel transport system ATP-binding protein
MPVSPLDIPAGCAFAPRCRLRHPACDERPALVTAGTGDGHRDACWLPTDERAALRGEEATS